MSRYDIRILKYEKLRLKGEKINDLKKYKTKIESLNNFSKVLEAEIFYKKLNLEKIENKINSQVSTKFIL